MHFSIFHTIQIQKKHNTRFQQRAEMSRKMSQKKGFFVGEPLGGHRGLFQKAPTLDPKDIASIMLGKETASEIKDRKKKAKSKKKKKWYMIIFFF